jgi:hypothetical protein
MKVNIQTLQDTFKIGYETFEQSRIEANSVWDLYHNRQWTDSQLDVLANRGQPAETFNVVKLFSRMLLGYYSTVVNTVQALPVQYNDIQTAAVLNDLIAHVLRRNNFAAEGDKIKLSGILAGLMVSYVDVVDTGQRDEFKRPIKDIRISHVPDSEVVLDPMSRLDDYSDARFIHRFKWLSADTVRRLFGAQAEKELEAYGNHLEIPEAEFTFNYTEEFVGKYKIYDNYLIVHSIVVDDAGRSWSVYWCGDTILQKDEVTHKEVRMPYRVQKLHTSDKAEYYGIFREVVETQKAINQALIKIQLMVNTQKAFVEDGAVENLSDFTTAFNRVSGVIPVKDLNGIRLESLSREVLDQYTIIDKGFDRIQRILSINDSFLGMAFASDSGRKVKLQQNATITALRYLTGRVEQFYRLLGWDIANLAKQYYTAHQVIRVADEVVGQRWVELNKPMQVWTGQMDPNTGEPIMQYEFEEVLDPATNEPLIDDEGNYVFAPIPEGETDIAFTDVDIEIVSNTYNDEDEKNQLMLETVLAGNVGNLLAQINPAGYFKAVSLSLRTMKTKYSPDIAEILNQTAMMLGGDPAAQQQASLMAQGASDVSSQMSSQLKLPQNTNEGF